MQKKASWTERWLPGQAEKMERVYVNTLEQSGLVAPYIQLHPRCVQSEPEANFRDGTIVYKIN